MRIYTHRGMHRAHTCGKGRNLEEGLFALPGKLGKSAKKNRNLSMKDMSPCICMHLELLGRSPLTPFMDTNGDTWFLYRTTDDMSSFEKSLDGRSALDMKIMARVKTHRKKDGGKGSTEESQSAGVMDSNMSSEAENERDKMAGDAGSQGQGQGHATEQPASGASNNACGGSSAAEDAANGDEAARKEDVKGDEDDKRKEKNANAAPKKRTRSYVDEMMEDQAPMVPRLRELFDDLLLKLTHVPVSNRLRALLDLNTALPGEGLTVARADGKGGDAASAKKDASKRVRKTLGGEEERPLWMGGGNKVCAHVCVCDVVHVWMYELYRDAKHVDFGR
jgi:hypothetical protein